MKTCGSRSQKCSPASACCRGFLNDFWNQNFKTRKWNYIQLLSTCCFWSDSMFLAWDHHHRLVKPHSFPACSRPGDFPSCSWLFPRFCSSSDPRLSKSINQTSEFHLGGHLPNHLWCSICGIIGRILFVFLQTRAERWRRPAGFGNILRRVRGIGDVLRRQSRRFFLTFAKTYATDPLRGLRRNHLGP